MTWFVCRTNVISGRVNFRLKMAAAYNKCLQITFILVQVAFIVSIYACYCAALHVVNLEGTFDELLRQSQTWVGTTGKPVLFGSFVYLKLVQLELLKA